MPLFTDADLEDFSDLAVDLAAKDLLTILRETKIPDGSGGSEVVWMAVETVPCLVIDGGNQPTEQVVAQQMDGRVVKKALFPRSTDIRGNDRLSTGGVLYEIIDLYDPTTYEVLRRALIRQGIINRILSRRDLACRARISA